MQIVKCFKCGWKGAASATRKQWVTTKTGNKDYDAISKEIIMLCPECKIGVCEWMKRN